MFQLETQTRFLQPSNSQQLSIVQIEDFEVGEAGGDNFKIEVGNAEVERSET